MSKRENNQPLTWNDLADLYDRHHGGRRARTLPMRNVAEWAEQRTDLLYVDEEDSFRLVRRGARTALGEP